MKEEYNLMKRYLVLLLIVCLTLVGCNAKDKVIEGQLDVKGIINEIDSEGNRILVNDPDMGLIWLALPDNGDITKYEEDQEVVVWIDGGIDTSSPAYAKALTIELLEAAQPSVHIFDYKNHEFPPYLPGFIEINETRYEMAKGNFEWRKGNQSVQTDAASPTQIAEDFDAIVVKPNSKVSIEIEQNASLSAYLWGSQRENVVLDGNELTVPPNKGRYIYEIEARWSNGEVSYTFVVDVN
jgi:hypothetical protein